MVIGVHTAIVWEIFDVLRLAWLRGRSQIPLAVLAAEKGGASVLWKLDQSPSLTSDLYLEYALFLRWLYDSE